MIKIKNNLNLKKEINEQTNLAKDIIIKKLIKDLKEETPVDTGAARDGWKYTGKSIVNEIPYIDDLNKGTSKQAPSYFIEKTLLKSLAVRPNGTIVTNL
jgi:hypothetical protein